MKLAMDNLLIISFRELWQQQQWQKNIDGNSNN